MLNRKTRYAIKALMHIARTTALQQPSSVAQISEASNIPNKFLEAILSDLKTAGYVVSKKGSAGGYYLQQSADQINLASLLRATNGPIAMVPCVSLNYYESCEHCPDESLCGIHSVMEEVRDANLKILNNTSIQDLIDKEEKLASKKPSRKRTKL
jgi:Rrf2 family protein